MTRISLFAVAGCLALSAATASGQTTPLYGGVPTGPATAAPLKLSLADVVARGLEQNLSVILDEQRLNDAGSARLKALSELIPHVTGSVRDSVQTSNLAAFGFTGFGGVDLPSLIGPFTVFDARLGVSAPIIDVSAKKHLNAESALVSAAKADRATVRETVVLAVGNLYLQVVADRARVQSAEAQIATAEALVRLTDDQHTAGLVPQIDVLRQQVQLQNARALQIAATAALNTRKLQLARAIGLPAGQAFELTSPISFLAAPTPTLEAAVAEAAAHRPDVVSARARVEAARAERESASTAALPTLHIDGDVGALGTTASSALKTYTVAAAVHVPIFTGGKTRADVQHADALLHQREAELADLENGLYYDVASALQDLQSAAAGVDVASSAMTLAQDELAQAQDRFRAGVAGSLELVQAQESVTRSSQQYISTVYAHTLAKAGLAKAMGVVEQQFLTLVGGQQ